MIRKIAPVLVVGALALAVAAPVAMAGEVEDEGTSSSDDVAMEDSADDSSGSEDTTESSSESASDDSGSDPVSEQQGGTDKCVDATECSKQPPEEPPVTPEPPDEPEPEVPDVEEPPEVELPIDDAPKDKGGGDAALPFTGIEDYFIPLAVGLLGLIGGFVLYRYAGLSDALRRFRGELNAEAADEQTTSAYGDALANMKDESAA